MFNKNLNFLFLNQIYNNNFIFNNNINLKFNSCNFFKSFKSFYFYNKFQLFNSIFNKFLESSIFIDKNLIIERINEPNSIIQNCIFKVLVTSNSGSAIYSSNGYNLNISYCQFIKCISISHGGAIYKINGNCKVNNCCFDSCEIKSAIDGYYGNSIYLTGNNLIFELNFIFKCGISISTSSDSSVYIGNGYYEVINNNYSFNDGCYNGGSGGLYISPILGSILKYNTISNCLDGGAIEFWYGGPTINKFVNIINNPNIRLFVFALIGSSATIENYCIFNTPISNIQLVYSSSLTFINCIGDFSNSQITYFSTIFTYIHNFYNCNFKNSIKQKVNINFKIYLIYLFIS